MSENSNGNSEAYDALASVVQTSVGQLLVPFHRDSDIAHPQKGMPANEFFEDFLYYANTFSSQCCLELCKALRLVSIVPEVRATPTQQLANELRKVVFASTDNILVKYVGAVKQLHLNLAEISGRLPECSLLGEALKGAAIGQVAGGFGRTGKALGIVGGIAAADQEIKRKSDLLDYHQSIELQSKRMALNHVMKYLNAVEVLPEGLMDFVCAKRFGAEIDFSEQARVVRVVQSHIYKKLQHARDFVEELLLLDEAAKRKKAAVELEAEAVFRAHLDGCVGYLAFFFGWSSWAGAAVALVRLVAYGGSRDTREVVAWLFVGLCGSGYGLLRVGYTLRKRSRELQKSLAPQAQLLTAATVANPDAERQKEEA